MSHPGAVTTKRRVWFGRRLQVLAPIPESPADVAGVERERVADGDEREGAVRVVGREPGPDVREETSRSRTLDPRPAVERENGIGQDSDLQALLGLNPGTSERSVVELDG